MKSYDERCMDVFSCLVQHGPLDEVIIYDFLDLGHKKVFNGIWQDLYLIITGYHKLTGRLIGHYEFRDSIASAKEIRENWKNDVLNVYDRLSAHQIGAGSFKYHAHKLVDLYKTHHGSKVLAESDKVLASQGYEGMRELLLKGLYDIDRVSVPTFTEGNVMDEADDIMKEYSKIQSDRDHAKTGLTEIDKRTGGFYPGELWLWAGYSGDGKTFSCVNIAYDIAYKQKRNVVFFTTETVRSVVRRRLVARHARELTGKGLDLTKWKKGELSDEDNERLQHALNDMRANEVEYGVFELQQLPADATTDYVAVVLARCQDRFDIDLCILDSIHLLRSKKQRQSSYAELDDTLIDIKKLIVAHNNGKGVPLLSPWHVNRASWEKAREDGRYTKASLAKTGEAERQADVIVSIFKEENGSRDLKGAILKNRDGEELEEFYLQYNFNQGYIGNRKLFNPADDLNLFEVN